MHFPRRGLGLCRLLDVIRLFLDRLLLGVLLHWLLGTRLDLLLRPGRLLSLWLRRNMLTFQRLLLLYRLLGRRALSAVERLMGMLLVAISVQMLLDGLSAYLGQGG